MSKKRRLSPSPSSRDSATPVPSIIPPQVTISQHLEPGSSPQPEGQDGQDGQDELALPGPSRLSGSASNSATPIPNSIQERTEAKAGNLVVGSGDGTEYGDECFLWADLPMNKQGFRYAPCSLSPTPSPSPLFPFYRTIPGPSTSPPVHISWLDRSSFLRLSPDGLTASTDRGYRSARANVGVRQGTWYYEALIVRGDGEGGSGGGTGGDVGNAHIRLGWGRREANLDAPVGMDGYSYAIRDVKGEKVHLSRPRPYGRTFRTGDVVGCLISIAPGSSGLQWRPQGQDGLEEEEQEDVMRMIKRKRVPIRYKGQFYFEMDEYGVQKEMEALVDREGKGAAAAAAAAQKVSEPVSVKDSEDSNKSGKSKKKAITKNAKKGKSSPVEPSGPIARHLPILKESRIEFFLNGVSLGTAFEDLYDYAPLPPLITAPTPSSTKKPHGHGNAQSESRSQAHPHPHDHMKDILFDDGTLGYYPMISCFGRGKVKVNFGPEWLAPPIAEPFSAGSVRPMVDRWDEFRAEEKRLDERDEERETIRLRKEMAAEEVRRKAAEAKLAAIRQNGASANSANGSPASGGGLKRKSGPKKKRKGTDTPTPATTPGPENNSQPGSTPLPGAEAEGTPGPDGLEHKDQMEGGDVKMEVETESMFSQRQSSRAGTEELVKREDVEGVEINGGMDVDGLEHDRGHAGAAGVSADRAREGEEAGEEAEEEEAEEGVKWN